MDIPITRDQLNNCTQLKKIYEEKEYQKELNSIKHLTLDYE